METSLNNPTANLEQRVAALETQYAELLELLRNNPARNAWRKVVGMFAGDPLIEQLHKETQRIHDEDRAAARYENKGDP